MWFLWHPLAPWVATWFVDAPLRGGTLFWIRNKNYLHKDNMPHLSLIPFIQQVDEAISFFTPFTQFKLCFSWYDMRLLWRNDFLIDSSHKSMSSPRVGSWSFNGESNRIKMADIDLLSFFPFSFLICPGRLKFMLLCLHSLFLFTMYGFQLVESNCLRA